MEMVTVVGRIELSSRIRPRGQRRRVVRRCRRRSPGGHRPCTGRPLSLPLPVCECNDPLVVVVHRLPCLGEEDLGVALAYVLDEVHVPFGIKRVSRDSYGMRWGKERRTSRDHEHATSGQDERCFVDFEVDSALDNVEDLGRRG